MSFSSETIFALSSGRPPAAIAVVRISGPRAAAALNALGVKTPEPRKAVLARVRDPYTKEMIDEALALFFPGPASETGEDIVELQVHGGRAVIAATLAALGKIEGLRPAEAGEFTRRAFENGKLDLTAVEGLADLVMAETEGQRALALRQMRGVLGRQAESWRARLIQALALVDAGIDFSDEDDVPDGLIAPALSIARELEGEIAAVLADERRGERLREGLTVAIAGPPNAGKSTLLNRIAKREAAIVSPHAGTTRDVIEVHLDLGGLPVTLIDTAGIRETDDPVEIEGVRRARERVSSADLVLWVEDASRTMRAEDLNQIEEADGTGPVTRPIVSDDVIRDQVIKDHVTKNQIIRQQVASEGVEHPAAFGTAGNAIAPMIWMIRNKIDLLNQGDRNGNRKNELGNLKLERNESINRINNPLTNKVNKTLPPRNETINRSNKSSRPVFDISAVSGTGFDALLAALSKMAEDFLAGSESALITRVRHRQVLEEVLAAMRRASNGSLAEREELLGEELRVGAAALGRLTGRIDVEDILDVIFRDFCIGK